MHNINKVIGLDPDINQDFCINVSSSIFVPLFFMNVEY